MWLSIQEILNFNPHWSSGTIAASPYPFKRAPFNAIYKWLDTRQILGLKGLRRTGKSVLITQLRDAFVASKQLQADQYFHLAFDLEDSFDLLPSEALNESISWYFNQRWPGKDIAFIKQPILISIDEIQNVRGWQKPLKHYYDLNPNIKFLVSGSAALFMRDAADSLAGRIMEFDILPMDFQEHIEFTGGSTDSKHSSLHDLFSIMPRLIDQQLLAEFERYLLIGGFPEAAQMSKTDMGIAEIQSYIKTSIIQKIISKDFKRYYQIKDTIPDNRLFELLCHQNAQPLNQSSLAKSCGLALDTFKRHFELFVEAGLLRLLAGWNSKPRRRIEAHKKIFLTAPSLAYSFLGYPTLPYGSFVGHTVEGYVYQRLLSIGLNEEIYYVKDNQGNEVDFFLPKSKIAIESKFSIHFDEKDFGFLVSASKKLKLQPLIISRDSWTSRNGLKAIPVVYM